MHSNVTMKNVSWPHFSWATLYVPDWFWILLIVQFQRLKRVVKFIKFIWPFDYVRHTKLVPDKFLCTLKVYVFTYLCIFAV